jgi:hypothetical protein
MIVGMETTTQPPKKAQRKRSITAREMGRRSAKARMLKLTPGQRSDIARRAVAKRWARSLAEREAAAAQLPAAARAKRLERQLARLTRAANESAA